jgi:hypothetical protein
MADLVARYVGSCQICEGNFKLTPHETLVHHGYKRPGIGNIVGDCPGVDYPPYEKSCDYLKSWTKGIEAELRATRAFLGKLERGEVHQLYVEREYGKPVEPITPRSVPDWEWKHALKRRISEVKHAVSFLDTELDRCARRISGWTHLWLDASAPPHGRRRGSEDRCCESRGACEARDGNCRTPTGRRRETHSHRDEEGHA